MTLLLRKLNLTAHVPSSVAWLGAVAAFLALSIAGLTSRDPDVVRGLHISMNLIGQFVIVPLSAAAFATGVAQSVGTEIRAGPPSLALLKLVLTIGSVLLLVLHQFRAVAGVARAVAEAASGTLPDPGPRAVQLA